MEKKGIYFIFGEDRFRLKSELAKLKENLLDEKKVFLKLSCKDDLQSSLFGLSLFAENKVVLIDFVDFSADILYKLLEENLEQISDNLEIIFYQTGKPDKRLKFYKFIEKIAAKIIEVPEFSPWKTQDIIKWASEHAKELNVKINNLALQKLIEFYDSDTASIDSELQKLNCYCQNQEIKLADIEALCQAQDNLFDLVDLLLAKQFSEFSEITKKLFLYQNPLQVLAGLQTIFRNYLNLKSLSNMPSAEIARLTSKNPWKTNQDLQKLKSISFDFLFNINQSLNQIEEDIKTGACFDPSLHFRFKILSL